MKRQLFLLLLLGLSYLCYSQERERIPLVDPVYRGWSAQLDIASPLMGYMSAPNTFNIEMIGDVNLYDRFFPVFELGYASIEKNIEERIYNTQAPYFRLGMNFNIIRTANNKGIYKDNKNYAYLGVRYAFSMLGYETKNVLVENDYWGDSYVIDYGNPFVYAGWAEIHGGVRVDLAKGFTMGWSVGLKFLMHTSEKNEQLMWYVPGYGKLNNMNFIFKYTVGYTFRTRRSKALIGTKLKKDKVNTEK